MKISLSSLVGFSCTISFACGFVFHNRIISSSNKFPMQETNGDGIELAAKPLVGENVAAALRKWYLVKYKRRADVVLESDASTMAGVITEAWKAVLVSLRVLNADVTLPSHTSIVSFTKFSLSKEDLESLQKYSQILENHLVESPDIFQTNINRKLTFYLQSREDPEWLDGPTLVLALDSFRVDPEQLFIDNIDEFEPSLENIMTNDIPGFPFDSVYDFISEINRPADPFTLSNLKYKFTISDLRFDTTKLKNKKDPKEIVLGINVRLTRLQKWRDLLSTRNGFDYRDNDMVYWSETVKSKYQSLISLVKLDPKRAMDTQYDKKKIFIDIIDKWSDRLKKVFKYQFISKNKPVDFMERILNSDWRHGVISTCALFSQAPFLSLEGPEFTPGEVPPLFPHEMPVTRSFLVDQVMYETLAWLDYIESAKDEADLENLSYGRITKHVYSRAMVTERALYDVWFGLSSWLEDGIVATGDSGSSAGSLDRLLLNSTAVVAELSETSKARVLRDSQSSARDHTDEFVEALLKINAFSRDRSNQDKKSVKELFKVWNSEAKELVDWWTNLVRDLDLTDVMEAKVKEASNSQPVVWSKVMDEVIRSKVQVVRPGMTDDVNRTATQLEWDRFRPIVQYAESLKQSLPWLKIDSERTSRDALISIPARVKERLSDDTVTVDFHPDTSLFSRKVRNPKRSLIVVLPRFFPGYGKTDALIAQEMGAFLDFYRIVRDDIAAVGLGREKNLKVIPLHPLLEDPTVGYADLMRRSPHPSFLFTEDA